MVDTKGYWQSTIEITKAQTDWVTSTITAINEYAGANIPSYVCLHVAMKAFLDAAVQKYGYVAGQEGDFIIPENTDGDSGILRTKPGGCDNDYTAFNLFKNNGVDAILAGHQHQNNASILYQGVRLVFGTKSSRYDKYGEDMLGGTLFTGIDSNFTVEHVYYPGEVA